MNIKRINNFTMSTRPLAAWPQCLLVLIVPKEAVAQKQFDCDTIRLVVRAYRNWTEHAIHETHSDAGSHITRQ